MTIRINTYKVLTQKEGGLVIPESIPVFDVNEMYIFRQIIFMSIDAIPSRDVICMNLKRCELEI